MLVRLEGVHFVRGELGPGHAQSAEISVCVPLNEAGGSSQRRQDSGEAGEMWRLDWRRLSRGKAGMLSVREALDEIEFVRDLAPLVDDRLLCPAWWVRG